MKLRSIISGILLSLAIISLTSCQENREIEYDFCHHVFFWLNNPESPADRAEFERGLTSLLEIDEIRLYQFGIPEQGTAGRNVVDGSYTYSLLVFFEDMEGHDIYQDHPVHLKFVEDYQHLWNRVVVYDSVVE
jgi:hypothetical protein